MNPIAEAIDWCVANGVLQEFLSERRKEIIKVMTIDMTFEAREEIIRREERELGIELGIAQGTLLAIDNFVVMLRRLNIPQMDVINTLKEQYPDYSDIIETNINKAYK